jgi:hypothetical protein
VQLLKPSIQHRRRAVDSLERATVSSVLEDRSMKDGATATLTAVDHARAMANYSRAGEARARALGNRGPIRFDANGKLDRLILDSYWTHGFYVFEGVVGAEELQELRADVDNVLAQAPSSPGAAVDRSGRPALGEGILKPPYRIAKPLSG